jgi:hypothetical protein
MKTAIKTVLAMLKYKIPARLMRVLLGAAFAMLLFHGPARWLSAFAAQPEPADGQSLADREGEIDKQHLRKIYDVIQAYKKKHGDFR